MADPTIQQLSAELGQLTRVLRDMVDASSRTVQAQRANAIALIDQNEALEDFKKQTIGGRKLNKQQQVLAQQAVDAKKKELRLQKEWAEAQKKAVADMKRHGASELERAASQRIAAAAHAKLSAAQGASQAATSALTNSFQGMVKGVNITNAALVWFGSTLKSQASQMLAQNAANSGVVEGTNSLANALWAQQNTALKYGLAGDEFAKITSANRQVINAMGGSKVAFETLNPSIDRFRILTGSMSEGVKLAAEAATEFAKKGIKPTMRGMDAYTNDIVALQRQTGMASRDAMAYFNEIASDADSIDLLRSARKEERESILASQRALVQQAIATGMSAEQAKEAAKMLNKMVAAKPLDRLKQAAKVRALSGAMGIAGGDEAAQAIIAGKRATAEQKVALAKFSENAANAMDQAAGQGLGSEIFANALIDKLDLDQYYGKNSVFSTTLGDTMKPAFGDLSKQFVDASKDSTAQLVAQGALLLEQAKLIASGQHWGGVIASGVAAIVAMMMGGKIMGAVGNVAGKALQAGKNLIGAGGNAAGAAARGAGALEGGAAAGTAATAAAGKGAGVLSKVAAAGKVAGVAGSALDVGFGMHDLMQGKAQEKMEGWDMISPMRWGMYAGDKINKGAESLMGGQSIGSKVYDWMHPDEGKALTQPVPVKPKADPAADAAKKTADSNAEIKVATMSSADSLAAQVKKMDSSNDILKKIADMTEKQLDLAERQLVALTMTDKERQNVDNKRALRKDSKFGAQYNYV